MILNETSTISQEIVELPLLGNSVNGTNEPFSELYSLDFPEWYDVE
jgi:hypothetical protein